MKEQFCRAAASSTTVDLGATRRGWLGSPTPASMPSPMTKTALLDGWPSTSPGQIDIGTVYSDMTSSAWPAAACRRPMAASLPRRVLRWPSGRPSWPCINLLNCHNVLFTTVMATKMPFVGRGWIAKDRSTKFDKATAPGGPRWPAASDAQVVRATLVAGCRISRRSGFGCPSAALVTLCAIDAASSAGAQGH